MIANRAVCSGDRSRRLMTVRESQGTDTSSSDALGLFDRGGDLRVDSESESPSNTEEEVRLGSPMGLCNVSGGSRACSQARSQGRPAVLKSTKALPSLTLPRRLKDPIGQSRRNPPSSYISRFE